MPITIITPINNLKFLNNSIENFNRQKYQNKELLLIFNGDLLNHNLKKPNANIYIERIDSKNISKIRNVGLDWMKKNNRSVFSNFDSDDYYGENYLIEVCEKLSCNYKLVGKLNFKFSYNSDIYSVTGLVESGTIQGPTITGYLTSQRYNEDYGSLAEDIEYISHFDNCDIGYTSLENWVYNVHSDSIQKRNVIQFIETIKLVNTECKNTNCVIYKNGNVYWKYGDGYNLENLFNEHEIDIGKVIEHHKTLSKFKTNGLV